MLKIENLKLADDIKTACNSDIEKKKAWEKEFITKKIVQEASNYATRFVPQHKGLGYDNVSSSKSVPSNIAIQQDHTCKEIGGTSAVHPNKKMQKLYVKLQNMKGK